MKARLINVRLDEEHLRKVRVLRREGVVLSELVREAIDTRFEAVVRARGPRDDEHLISRIFEEYPDRTICRRASTTCTTRARHAQQSAVGWRESASDSDRHGAARSIV